MLNAFTKRSLIFAGTAGAAALIASACSSTPGGSSGSASLPTSPSAGLFRSFAAGDSTTSTPVAGQIKVCKSSTSNVSGTFTVTAGGAVTTVSPTIAPNNCVVVAQAGP